MPFAHIPSTFRRGVATTAILVAVALTVPGTAFAQAPTEAEAPGPVVMSNTASASGFPVGVAIYDSVNIGQGIAPTGTVTFSLFGPDNASCSGSAIFQSTTPINGGGYYQSDYYTTNASGTYRWIARYSGDANNPPLATSCSDPNASTAVAKRTPTLNGTASPVLAGGRITDTATFGNSAGPSGASGTLTFTVYGPDNMVCSGSPVFTSTKTVAGNGQYTSDAFVPGAPGTYRWTLRYSGDAHNNPQMTICADEAQDVTVTGGPANGDGGDYNGNGTTDHAVFRPSNGTWYVRDGAFNATTWGIAGDIPVPGDYDGNGTTDVAVYRPSNGTWYVRHAAAYPAWGISGDIAVPGDYDGNGTTDVAVFRPSTGEWFVRGSTWGNPAWGASGDIPVPADYDGNGTTDIAVYRPSTGVWYVRNAVTHPAWGIDGDIPVPGDYDGNWTTDMAVYRPSTGEWFVRGSSGGFPAWGIRGDIPVPGDYDGNGRTDIAVYRPSTGVWYVRNAGVQPAWGVSGDIPLPLSSAIRQSYF